MDPQVFYRLMQQALHRAAQIPSSQMVVEQIAHEMPPLPTDRPLNVVDVNGARAHEVRLNEAKENLESAKALAAESMNELLTHLPESVKEQIRDGGTLEVPRQPQEATGARLSYREGEFVVENY